TVIISAPFDAPRRHVTARLPSAHTRTPECERRFYLHGFANRIRKNPRCQPENTRYLLEPLSASARLGIYAYVAARTPRSRTTAKSRSSAPVRRQRPRSSSPARRHPFETRGLEFRC